MAVNPNRALNARHVLVLGMTGSGKSQVLKNLIQPKGQRVVAFDPDGDHVSGAGLFTDFRAFCQELIRADSSGKPYRLGFQGSTRDDFRRFCRAAWDVLDGQRDTHIICEEAAAFTSGSGPAEEEFSNLLLRSRKYAGIVYTLGQRAAEVPTTARNQSMVRYIGLVDGLDDAKHASKLFDVPPEVLIKTPPDELRFWKKVAGQEPEFVQFKYMG